MQSTIEFLTRIPAKTGSILLYNPVDRAASHCEFRSDKPRIDEIINDIGIDDCCPGSVV